jgi:IS30 family transposase
MYVSWEYRSLIGKDDNGNEFAEHKSIARKRKTDFYFTHSCSYKRFDKAIYRQRR